MGGWFAESIAEEIMEDRRAVLEQFAAISAGYRSKPTTQRPLCPLRLYPTGSVALATPRAELRPSQVPPVETIHPSRGGTCVPGCHKTKTTTVVGKRDTPEAVDSAEQRERSIAPDARS